MTAVADVGEVEGGRYFHVGVHVNEIKSRVLERNGEDLQRFGEEHVARSRLRSFWLFVERRGSRSLNRFEMTVNNVLIMR